MNEKLCVAQERKTSLISINLRILVSGLALQMNLHNLVLCSFSMTACDNDRYTRGKPINIFAKTLSVKRQR